MADQDELITFELKRLDGSEMITIPKDITILTFELLTSDLLMGDNIINFFYVKDSVDYYCDYRILNDKLADYLRKCEKGLILNAICRLGSGPTNYLRARLFYHFVENPDQLEAQLTAENANECVVCMEKPSVRLSCHEKHMLCVECAVKLCEQNAILSFPIQCAYCRRDSTLRDMQPLSPMKFSKNYD